MEDTFTFCPTCGTRAEAVGRFCAGCGESLARELAASLTAAGATAFAKTETLEVPVRTNGVYAAAPGLTAPPVVDISTEPTVVTPPVEAPADAASETDRLVSPPMVEMQHRRQGPVAHESQPLAAVRRSRLKTGLLCGATATGSAALVVLVTGVAGVW